MSLIRNRNQTRQAIDFSGIQNGKIHPTDIDGVLEFDNEVLILFEVKRFKNDIPIGQRLVLERICDSWKTKKSIVLFVNVNIENDIDYIMGRATSLTSHGYNLNIDLENNIINDDFSFSASFEIDLFRRDSLLKGQDEIARSLTFDNKIQEFELKRISRW